MAREIRGQTLFDKLSVYILYLVVFAKIQQSSINIVHSEPNSVIKINFRILF